MTLDMTVLNTNRNKANTHNGTVFFFPDTDYSEYSQDQNIFNLK